MNVLMGLVVQLGAILLVRGCKDSSDTYFWQEANIFYRVL